MTNFFSNSANTQTNQTKKENNLLVHLQSHFPTFLVMVTICFTKMLTFCTFVFLPFFRFDYLQLTELTEVKIDISKLTQPRFQGHAII